MLHFAVLSQGPTIGLSIPFINASLGTYLVPSLLINVEEGSLIN